MVDINLDDFKPIPKFENYLIDKYGNVYSKWTRKFLKWVETGGNGRITRLQVTLYGLDYSRENIGIGSLVLRTWVGPCPEGMECCHNDGNYMNNYIDNLRWDTRRNNHIDKFKHGTMHTVKHSKEIVLEIRKLFDSREYKEWDLVEKFNIPISTISHIVHRRTWKHLP